MAKTKARKYYRKCGYCGERFEQSDMVRTNIVKNGWLCKECYQTELPRYDFISDAEDLCYRIGSEAF